MISFKDWLCDNTIITKDKAEEALLDKIANDKSFPRSVRLCVMLDYLENSYSKKEIGIFETYYFQEYIKYITAAEPPV